MALRRGVIDRNRRQPDMGNLSRAEFERMSWDMLAQEQQRVQSWVPMVYQMRQLKKQREKEWALATAGIEYQQALGLERERQSGDMDRLAYEWERRGTLGIAEQQSRQQADEQADALSPQESGFVGTMYPELAGISSRKTLNAIVPLLRDKNKTMDEQTERAFIDQNRATWKAQYPEYGAAWDLVTNREEALKLVGEAEKTRKTAKETAAKDAVKAQESAFTQEWEALAPQIEKAKAQKGPGDVEYQASGVGKARWTELRKAGISPREIMAEPWLRVATEDEFKAAFARNNGDEAATTADLRKAGLVP